MDENKAKCLFLGTMVLKVKKTAVPVLVQGLFDRSRSRTVDILVATVAAHQLSELWELKVNGRFLPFGWVTM